MKQILLLFLLPLSTELFCQTIDVVQNGGFESQLQGWSYTANWGWFTTSPCAGTTYALTADVNGYGLDVLGDRLQQSVLIPSGATSATLSFCFKTLSNNANSASSGDFMSVYFNGSQIGGLIYPQPSSSYQTASITVPNISNYSGQYELLEFYAYGVADGYWSKFYLDNVSLVVAYTACNSFSASSPSTISSAGGSGQSSISASPSCSWTASASCGWVTLNNTSGTGNGTVSFTVNPNCSSYQSCTVNISSGGSVVTSFTVNQSGVTSPSSPTGYASPASICTGQTSTLYVNGPCSGCTYSWGAGCTPQGGSPYTSATVTAAGTYNVTVTDNCGGSAVGSITVSQSSQTLTANITPASSTICPTATTQLTVNTTPSGSYGYVWSPSSAGTSSTATVGVGNYSVTVTNTQCTAVSATASASVSAQQAPATPQLQENPNTSLCSNQPATLTVSNQTAYNNCPTCTFTWCANCGTGTTYSHTITGPGTYSVTVSNSCNQSVSQQVIISPNTFQPPAPTFNPTALSVCSGQTGTLSIANTAQCSGCTYRWSCPNGNCSSSTGTTNTITGSGAITVIDSNSCGLTNTATITVNSNPVANITASAPSFCAGDSVLFTVTSGSQYIWNTGAVTQSIYVKNSNTYNVTVTNPGGCTGNASATKSVTVNNHPIANAGSPQTIQIGQTVHLGGPASGGTAPYQYFWSGGVANNTSDTTSAVITTPSDFCVTVTDNNGCTGSACVHIDTTSQSCSIVLNHPSKTFGANGGYDTIQVSAQSNCSWTATTNNQWIHLLSGLSGIGNSIPPGIRYFIDVCQGTADSIGTINANATVFTVTQNCQCSLTGPVPVTPFGNILTAQLYPGATYQWYLFGSLIPGQTSASITATQSGVYSVQVCMGGCCITSVNYSVTVGINDIGLLNNLKIYPNPANTVLNVELHDIGSEKYTLTITNSLGEKLLLRQEQTSNGGGTTRIDLNSYSPGMYFVTITTEKGKATKGITIER